MLNWLARRADAARKADNLYGAVVAQARQPAFYRDFGIADTLEGRFETVVLHMVLVLERLRGAAPDRDLQLLIERFVTDMDDCMREIGVGDMAVPKRVKRAAAALYERAEHYRGALADGDEALQSALKAEFAKSSPAPRARALAGYVRAAAAALQAQALDEVLTADLAFPNPDAYAAAKEVP